MKNITLEELEKRETDTLMMTKQRNTANVSKIQARVNAETDPDELEKLKALLTLHKSHKKELGKIDPKEKASIRFEKLSIKK